MASPAREATAERRPTSFISMSLNAGKLFEKALESLAVSARPPTGVNEFAAASASILFAHISSDGFINELGMLADLWRERTNAPGWIGTLADATRTNRRFAYSSGIQIPTR